MSSPSSTRADRRRRFSSSAGDGKALLLLALDTGHDESKQPTVANDSGSAAAAAPSAAVPVAAAAAAAAAAAPAAPAARPECCGKPMMKKGKRWYCPRCKTIRGISESTCVGIDPAAATSQQQSPTHSPQWNAELDFIYDSILDKDHDGSVSMDDWIEQICKGLHGVVTRKKVEKMVDNFAKNEGIVSELSSLTKKECSGLLDRLIEELYEQLDTDHDGRITEAEFCAHMRRQFGFKARLVKGQIRKSFKRLIELGDTNKDDCLSKEECLVVLRQFLSGKFKTTGTLKLVSRFL